VFAVPGMSTPLPRSGRYRERIVALAEQLLAGCARAERALDFGCGDGWFGEQFVARGLTDRVIGAEVRVRAGSPIRPVLFDGQLLPFGDGVFELTYAIDVLHHSESPEKAITELLRCTRDRFLLKDHTYEGPAGWVALATLDELGNRRFGVPSPHAYQKRWEWNAWIERSGFELERMVHPAPCHSGALGALTNRFQFVAVWRRAAPRLPSRV
jgi:SAM-dependent methyltransferase